MAVQSKNYIMLMIGKVLYITFPNFEALNTKNLILSHTVVSNSFFLFNTLYAFLYLAIILGLTIIIFNFKTFES